MFEFPREVKPAFDWLQCEWLFLEAAKICGENGRKTREKKRVWLKGRWNITIQTKVLKKWIFFLSLFFFSEHPFYKVWLYNYRRKKKMTTECVWTTERGLGLFVIFIACLLVKGTSHETNQADGTIGIWCWKWILIWFWFYTNTPTPPPKKKT